MRLGAHLRKSPAFTGEGGSKTGSIEAADSELPACDLPQSSSSSRTAGSGPVAQSKSAFDCLSTSHGQQQHKSGTELQSTHSAAGFW